MNFYEFLCFSLLSASSSPLERLSISNLCAPGWTSSSCDFKTPSCFCKPSCIEPCRSMVALFTACNTKPTRRRLSALSGTHARCGHEFVLKSVHILNEEHAVDDGGVCQVRLAQKAIDVKHRAVHQVGQRRRQADRALKPPE